jgi:hypothetical protein
VLVVLLVLVAALLIRLALQAYREWRAPGEVRDSLGAAIEQERASFDSDRDAARPATLDRFTTDLGDPVSSALGYSCELRSVDQGWFAVDWRQTCQWWATDYYVLADAGQDSVLPEDARRFGSECRPVTVSSAYDSDIGMAIDAVELVPGQTDDGRPCRLPHLLQDDSPRERTVAVEAADEGAIGLDDLGPEDRVVAVSYEREFFSEDVGCGIGLLFCTSPLDAPAVPEQ